MYERFQSVCLGRRIEDSRSDLLLYRYQMIKYFKYTYRVRVLTSPGPLASARDPNTHCAHKRECSSESILLSEHTHQRAHSSKSMLIRKCAHQRSCQTSHAVGASQYFVLLSEVSFMLKSLGLVVVVVTHRIIPCTWKWDFLGLGRIRTCIGTLTWA